MDGWHHVCLEFQQPLLDSPTSRRSTDDVFEQDHFPFTAFHVRYVEDFRCEFQSSNSLETFFQVRLHPENFQAQNYRKILEIKTKMCTRVVIRFFYMLKLDKIRQSTGIDKLGLKDLLLTLLYPVNKCIFCTELFLMCWRRIKINH